MQSVLLDTDVILDFFFDREPYADDATSILALCENKKLKGYITPVIISNIYYLLRKTAKPKYVIDKLKQLIQIVDVQKMDKQTVVQALNSPLKDFEDALQNAAAGQSNTISTIITRNIKDYKKSDLAVMTPELFLKGKV